MSYPALGVRRSDMESSALAEALDLHWDTDRRSQIEDHDMIFANDRRIAISAHRMPPSRHCRTDSYSRRPYPPSS